MRNAVIATGAAAGLLALATGAQAQQARQINFGAQLRAVHDSNFARSDAATAALRGVDRAEDIISPSLTADISLPVSRQTFFLRGSIGRDYYLNNSFLNAARYDVNSGFALRVGLCQGSINAGLQEAQSDLQDLTLLTTKNVSTQITGSFDILCGRSSGFAPSLRASTTTTRNSAENLRTSDSDEVSGELGLAYRRPSLGVITVYGSQDKTDYNNPLIAGGPGLIEGGYTTDAFGVRYDRHLGARIGGTAEIGYSHTKPDSALVPESKGWIYMAAIDFRVSSRLSTSLNLSRQTQPTIRQGALYSVNTIASLTADYAVGSRIRLTGGLEYGENNFSGISTNLPNVLTKESYDAIYGTATYSIGRRISLALDARYEERDANVSGFDYSSTQVGVTAIGKF